MIEKYKNILEKIEKFEIEVLGEHILGFNETELFVDAIRYSKNMLYERIGYHYINDK